MLSIVTSMTLIPTAAADTPTHAFVSVSPNPVGVNQNASISMWIDKPQPTLGGIVSDVWHNYTLTVTKPDGTKETFGPFDADPASFVSVTYKPTTIGTYILKFTFPGQQVTGEISGYPPIPIDEYYEPSTFSANLTVQTDPVNAMPQNPIPIDYWARPIDAQNQAWYTISGNWLGIGLSTFGNTYKSSSGNFQAYSSAPNSAHIVWKKPITDGGLIGGEYGGEPTSNYYTGKTYEPLFTPPVIINGVLYYNAPNAPKEGFYAVDLRTGETLWWQNSTGPVTKLGLAYADEGYAGYAGISCGQILHLKTPNEEGGRAYLWFMGFESDPFGPSIYKLYDASTGQYLLSLVNAVQGTNVIGPNGEMLVYIIDPATNQLSMWNSTKAIWNPYDIPGTSGWDWRIPVGATLEWARGIQWTVDTPPELYGQAIWKIRDNIILANTGTIFAPQNFQMEAAYDATTGENLWFENRTTPAGASQFGLMGVFENGIYTEYDKGDMIWTAYSATTGKQVWGPSEAYTNAGGSLPQDAATAYGAIYHPTLNEIHALNLTTGKLLWTFASDSSGTEFPGFSNYPFTAAALTVADGKVFAATGTSHGAPAYRGARLYAINATSGSEVWSINMFSPDAGTIPVADGSLVAFNGYDNSLYCFSKGQTATTVDAPATAIKLGSSLVIRGTVTDQSSGQTCLGIPAKGTPAIADESMSAWMEYLYMQKPKPTDATGVGVTLSVLDSNDNYREIGTTTSNTDGFFTFNWTPDITGQYTVYASFAGSESYWPSHAVTSFAVDEAAPTAAPTQAPAQSAADMYFVPAVAGIIAAIAIVGAVIVLMLRRK